MSATRVCGQVTVECDRGMLADLSQPILAPRFSNSAMLVAVSLSLGVISCARRTAYRAGELDDRSMIISLIVLYSVEIRSLYVP